MSLLCPKCGKSGFREVITKYPPAEDLVYRCCGQRRHFYYDDVYGWESQDEKQLRVRESIICAKCKEPFVIAYESNEKGNSRTVCDKCFLLYGRVIGERRKEENRKKGKTKRLTTIWGQFKHGGHNGCQRKE